MGVRVLIRNFWPITAAAVLLSACTQITGTRPSMAIEPVASQDIQLASLIIPTLPPLSTTPWPHPRPKAVTPLHTIPPRYQSIGVASWYGPKFHGRMTASGEVYNMHGLTAAHRSLPFGTEVKVTNLTNNLTLNLVVNDRGPYVDKRVIDVSYHAAVLLGFVDDGLADVKIVAVE